MEPIDKILIRAAITLMGLLFGWWQIKGPSPSEVRETMSILARGSKLQQAGPGPALPGASNATSKNGPQ